MAIRIDGTNTTANPGITGADADTGLQFGTNELKLVTGGTEAVKIDSNQKLTASQGILFGTDTAAANTLDDYEEGTWTPVFEGSVTAGTYTYTTQQGSYTKIGRQVNATFSLNSITTSSVGSGAVNITGLPFANNSTFACIGSVEAEQFNVADNTVNLSLRVASTNSYITIVESRDNANFSNVSVTDKSSNTAEIRGTITYFTD